MRTTTHLRSSRTLDRRPTTTLPLVLLVATLVVGVAVLAVACEVTINGIGGLKGSGDLETQKYDLEDFTSLDVSHAFQVTVTQSDSFSVSVTADDNVLEFVEVELRGNTLHIGIDRAGGVNATLRATITMPQLRGIVASGASKVNISGFRSEAEVTLEVSGASTITGDLESGDVDLEVSGASTIELDGSAEDLVADVSGASRLQMDEFQVTDADLDISGASKVTVKLEGTLSADVSGASKLTYIGEPTLGDISVSGASTIQRE